MVKTLNWDVETPEFTEPLTESGSRTILSKSNAAIRVTTETGYAVRRQGETKIFGEVDSDSLEILDDETLPAIETLSGNIPGLDEREQEQLEERLEYLGYK